MLGIDTNVVVRLIVLDDVAQTRRARRLVEQALSRHELVPVSLLVVLESEWVLRSRYGFNRQAVLAIFRALLEARELSFEDEPALEEALFRWRLGFPALSRSSRRCYRTLKGLLLSSVPFGVTT